MILGIILVFIIILAINYYNKLVKLKGWVDESWSQIDVQLIRRFDLIPNLVETAKGYAKHEQETFEKIVQARNQLLNAQQNGASREEILEQNENLTSSLKTIFALTESYPELKANEQFKVLQEELISTENKISYSRQLYTSTAAKYNISIKTFPMVIFANMFGFKPETVIIAKEEAKEPVKVSF
ncbi:MAG: LemA family protein [Romboutsia sp.]|nr:LemA family protein [Romboutsia sp.]